MKGKIFAAVLIAAVGASAIRIFWFLRPEHQSPNRTVIRLGHYLPAPATRQAILDVIAEYERRHPDVQVIAMPIPERTYLPFLNAHLTAGTAPDLLQIGLQYTGFEELRAKYFLPITAEAAQANPYNAGTGSAGIPWRETFIDGQNSVEAYSTAERQYYGVSMALNTLRIFYNRTLLQEITGADQPPRDYPEFIALCDRIEAYARRTGRPVTPVAGSRLGGLFLMSQIFSSVTQRLAFDLDGNHSLLLSWWDYPKAYVEGKWSFDTPAIRAGYDLLHEAGRHLQQGFLELPQSEAGFQFLQQRAVMTIALTVDSVVLRDTASFPVGVAPMPLVKPDDPRYGQFVLGPLSEANMPATLTFGVVQRSAHREVALDFLRFLGSHPASEIFSRRTGWMPLVASVPTQPSAEALKPVMQGYSGRFFAEMNGLGDGRFVVARNLYLLFAADDGAARYRADLAQHYGPAMRRDLQREVTTGFQNLRRQEPVMFGTLNRGAGSDEALDRLVSSQNYTETRLLQTRLMLERHPE